MGGCIWEYGTAKYGHTPPYIRGGAKRHHVVAATTTTTTAALRGAARLQNAFPASGSSSKWSGNGSGSGAARRRTRCISRTSWPDPSEVRIQTQPQFTGLWQCAATTFAKEGMHGFFKGMALPVTTISMTSSVVFGTYRNCLQCLSEVRGAAPGAPNTKLEVFLSGMAGGVAQILVMSPGDMVKVRLQCQTESSRGRTNNMPAPKYRGPVHCLLQIVREEGVLGLYKGALPLMMRDGPSFATYFLTYDTICEWMTPVGKDGPGWRGVMLAGGLAGMAGWTLGTPMDVIKARLQMDGARETRRYRGLVHCVSETVRLEGAGIFFRSLGINWMRAFPVNMVLFVTYETLIGFWRTTPAGARGGAGASAGRVVFE